MQWQKACLCLKITVQEINLAYNSTVRLLVECARGKVVAFAVGDDG